MPSLRRIARKPSHPKTFPHPTLCELSSPPHLWQLGLASAQGRTYESVSVLITSTPALREFFECAERILGNRFRVVPHQTAHVTLAGVENEPVTWKPAEFQAGSAEITTIDVTGFSIRLVPPQAPFAQIASRLKLPPPQYPYGITIAYALARIPLAEVSEFVGILEAALRERAPFFVKWEFVERQRRPVRDAFGYERVDSCTGKRNDTA
jgi:hypothetical protein